MTTHNHVFAEPWLPKHLLLWPLNDSGIAETAHVGMASTSSRKEPVARHASAFGKSFRGPFVDGMTAQNASIESMEKRHPLFLTSMRLHQHVKDLRCCHLLAPTDADLCLERQTCNASSTSSSRAIVTSSIVLNLGLYPSGSFLLSSVPSSLL